MYPKEVNTETRDICTPMFIAALFTIAKIQVFIDGQVDKQMWSILKWKMNEPWGHYAKWNKPVTKKDKSCVILLMRNTQRGPSLGDRKWASGCHRLRGRRGSPLKGVEFQFFLQVSVFFFTRGKKFWRWMVVMLLQLYEFIWYHWTVHLKKVAVAILMLWVYYHKKIWGNKREYSWCSYREMFAVL